MEACLDCGSIAGGHTLVISLQHSISAISSLAIMLVFKLDIILSIAWQDHINLKCRDKTLMALNCNAEEAPDCVWYLFVALLVPKTRIRYLPTMAIR